MARIQWEKPTAELFRTARERSQLIILYFGDRADTNDLLNEVDVTDHVTARTVVCVRVPKPQDEADEAGRLWKQYGISEQDTFVVADRFGNAAFVTQERALAAKLREVASHFRGVRKQLRQEIEVAKQALEQGEQRKSIEASLRAHALRLQGYDEAEEASKFYTGLIEQGRKELKAAKDDPEKLNALRDLYAGTELEAEIMSKLG